MKFRKDFVTNSSSSSYICEICGAECIGMDLSLSDAEMSYCVNGHCVCDEDMYAIPMELMISELMQVTTRHGEEDLAGMSYGELRDQYNYYYDGRWNVPEECCPICRFEEYSDEDMAAYLLAEYKISREEVFSEIKKHNRRRRKLYDSEYIAHVCQKHNLNLAEIPRQWKETFGRYAIFKKYLKENKKTLDIS